MPKSAKPEKPSVVLDTNVLVAGLLKQDSPPGKILATLAIGSFQPLYSAALLAEYETVLIRPRFNFDPEIVHGMLEFIQTEGDEIQPLQKLEVCSHDADNRFLECAVEGKAHYLVTGNLKDFPAKSYLAVQIVNPRTFIEKVPC